MLTSENNKKIKHISMILSCNKKSKKYYKKNKEKKNFTSKNKYMYFNELLDKTKFAIQKFHKTNPSGIIIIQGPTATGKTKLSIALSDFFPVEIISADSRQIFKEMNIGTDKIPQEYRKKVAHHQIDIISPDENYTAGERQVDTKRHIQNIKKRKNIPIIVGGTGLYIDTIYKNFTLPNIPPDYKLRKELENKEKRNPGYLHKILQEIDPEEAQKNHPNSIRYLIRALEIFYNSGKTKTETFKEQSVDQPILMIGIQRDKETTNTLIHKRIQEMFKEGLIKEVKTLLEKYNENLQSMQGIGYKEVIPYLKGEYDKITMEQQLYQNTTHLAKKQRTRFRRYENDAKINPKKNLTYINYIVELEK